MRFSFLSGVRNDLIQLIADYVFNPINGRSHNIIDFSYVGNPGSHGITVQDTYTVPANKVAHITGAQIHVLQRSTPSTVFNGAAEIRLTKSGGSAQYLMRTTFRLSTVDDIVQLQNNLDLWIEAGDVIDIRTTDLSSGGNPSFNVIGVVQEYDA
jgi:hypothetical protein